MTKLLHGNEKNSLTGGREPLFSQKELLVLAVPLLVEQLLEVTVGLADTMMAVSYTHLDVYKRQGLHHADRE